VEALPATAIIGDLSRPGLAIVNACLRDGRGGSPTAVLWETELTDADRRRVPQLAGTSHAVFVSARDDRPDEARASLRFFTSTGELPACGHGTVAALAFLAEHAQNKEYGVTLSAGGRSFAGEARRTAEHTLATFDPGEVRLRPANAPERDLVLDVFGPDLEIVASEICVASIGRPRLLVPVATRSALARLSPDYDLLRDGCDGLGLLDCYVHSIPTTDGRLAARMFAPSIGVPEDIARGGRAQPSGRRIPQPTRLTGAASSSASPLEASEEAPPFAGLRRLAGSRPARRVRSASRYSIWALTLRRSSSAHRRSASNRRGSSRSRNRLDGAIPDLRCRAMRC
jgi:trans-2,3-dihydro-3-hydroxyanthranilate isomerase